MTKCDEDTVALEDVHIPFWTLLCYRFNFKMDKTDIFDINLHLMTHNDSENQKWTPLIYKGFLDPLAVVTVLSLLRKISTSWAVSELPSSGLFTDDVWGSTLGFEWASKQTVKDLSIKKKEFYSLNN